MKRIITLSLALLMVLTLCVPAMAAGLDFRKKVTYVALGDSIPNVTEKGAIKDEQLYPNLLAKKLTGLWQNCTIENLSYPGWRTDELRYVLEKSYDPDFFTRHVINFYGGSTQIMLNGFQYTYPAAIQSADLISLELGSNDLMGNAIVALSLGIVKALSVEDLEILLDLLPEKVLNNDQMAKYFTDLGLPREISQLAAWVHGFAQESPLELNLSLLEALMNKTPLLIPHAIVSTVQSILPTVASLLKFVNSIELEFRENWDAIIRDIRRLNPDATLVAVSLYVPPKYQEGDLAYPIVSSLINNLNRYISEDCPYASEYIYVDITGISTQLPFQSDNSHPGVKGHEYIANRIYAELTSRSRCTHPARYQEKRNVYQTPILHYGYSGDTYCSNCGALLSHGTVKGLIGSPVQIPKTIEADIYSMVTTNIAHTLHNLFPLFA